jgi:hypothetical protein
MMFTFASVSNSFAGVSVTDVHQWAGADSIIANCVWDVNNGCTCNSDIQQPHAETHSFSTVAFTLPRSSIHSSLTATGVNSNHATFALNGTAHGSAAKEPNVCGNYEVGGGAATANITINLATVATMHVHGTLRSSPAITPNQSQHSQADFYVCHDCFTNQCYACSSGSDIYYKRAAEGTVENFDDIITLPAGTFGFGFGGNLTYVNCCSSGAGAATYSYVEADQDTSRDASWDITVEITTGTPTSIRISLDPSPARPNTYVITDAPAMPLMGAKAKVVGVTPDPTASTRFHWQISLLFKDVIPFNNYNQDIERNNLVTVGEQPIHVTFKDPTAFRGGTLTFTATATVNGTSVTGILDNVEIQGKNPLRTRIQEYVDTVVPRTGFSGLGFTDIADALKRMACLESRQRQFDAAANGGVGSPLISNDLGLGVFQITKTKNCPEAVIDCPEVIFNWQANTREGWNAFKTKIRGAKAYPAALASSPEYGNYIRTIINPRRVAAGLRPITIPPSPAFTTSGLLGSNPPNQLLEDAVRGYNGYATALRLNGHVVHDSNGNRILLHEFIPNESYLSTVPNNALTRLHQDPNVWRRVMPRERPQKKGDPSYVEHVICKTSTCISTCVD